MNALTDQNLDPSKLFNPLGDDDPSRRTLIRGGTTGLFNLNNVKYPWAKSMYQLMIGNFWVPEKVNGLGNDARAYSEGGLTPDEKRAYRGILSFLIFLDSIQTTNLPNFGDYVTAPEVQLLLAIQTYQEAIHSQSYATILETVCDSKEREEIYYLFRDDKILLERNTYIGSIYQDFVDAPNDRNFFRGLIANYLLEGLYFYNGFAFFDTLSDNQKMLATGRMISYIRRDELTHVTLFANMLRELKKEFPDMWDEALIEKMFREAVDGEVKWAQHILGNNIAGLSHANTETYTKWLANQRLATIGMAPLWPEITANPYKHLDRIQNNNGEKGNFFESTVVNYTQSSSMKGSWEF